MTSSVVVLPDELKKSGSLDGLHPIGTQKELIFAPKPKNQTPETFEETRNKKDKTSCKE